jgi:hypothetical protein
VADPRTHLVGDWNGTLLNDLALVVACTNAAFASAGGSPISVDQHRVKFRRPVADYYADVLGRAVDADEFGRLDMIFHHAQTACGPGAVAIERPNTSYATWPSSRRTVDRSC